jgi:putative heme iron utilization protein
MSDRIRPTDDQARQLAKTLIHCARATALATLQPPDGHPFASLVTAAPDFSGTPIILISSLSGHAVNLEADARCTLLCASSGKGDPLQHPRISVVSRARRLGRKSEAGVRAQRRFLAFNPKAELYVNFADFSFHALDIVRASLNGGFGKAYELRADDLLPDISSAAALMAAEPELLDQLNGARCPALQRIAVRAQRAAVSSTRSSPHRPPRAVRACGIDSEGIDIVSSAGHARVHFTRSVDSPEDFWMMFDQLLAPSQKMRGTPS